MSNSNSNKSNTKARTRDVHTSAPPRDAPPCDAPPRVRRLLALDCATRTGWAIIEGGEVVESGMKEFLKKKDDHPGKRFGLFDGWLCEIVYRHNIDALVFEQAHHRGGAATRVCVGLTTLVKQTAYTFRIPVSSIHSGTIKKFATGNGRASKRDMHDAAWEVLERVPVDDNEADAVFLGLCAWENIESERED